MTARAGGARRHLVILPLLLLACAGFFAWAAYNFLPPAANAYRRQIINDDYSTLSAPLAAGDEITQDIVVKGRIYGLILDVSTFGRVPRGTLHLRLHLFMHGQGGAVVSACDTDMSQLLDNTFHRFLFDVPVDGGEGTRYRLSITASPEGAQDAVAFHQSDGPAQDLAQPQPDDPSYNLADFSLAQNNRPDDGTLALQYITRYAGDAPARLFAMLAALLCALALLAYCLLFAFRFSLSWVAVAACLLLGLVFILLLPAHAMPQKEPLADVYHHASALLGQAGGDGPATLGVRAQDAFMWRQTPMDVFAWQDGLGGLPAAESGSVQVEAARAGIPPVFTAPLVLVFALCRLLGVSGPSMLLAARVVNLLLYTGIAFLALRRMPLAKPFLAALFLLPASLQAAVSFSGSGLALALVLLFCATLLRRWEKHPRWEWQKAPLLALLAAALAGLVFSATRTPLLLWTPPAGMLLPTAETAANTPLAAQASLPDALLSTLIGGPWSGTPATAAPGWLVLLALVGLVWALSLPALGAQRPFSKKTRFTAGFGAGLFALAAILPALLLPAVPDAICLLPALFLLLLALRGRNLAFARDACRPLLFAFILLAVALQANFFIIIAGKG